MTENDYIAEYIKERHPGDLSFDFAMWKLARKISEVGKELVQIFQSDEFKQVLSEKAEERAKDDDRETKRRS